MRRREVPDRAAAMAPRQRKQHRRPVWVMWIARGCVGRRAKSPQLAPHGCSPQGAPSLPRPSLPLPASQLANCTLSRIRFLRSFILGSRRSISVRLLLGDISPRARRRGSALSREREPWPARAVLSLLLSHTVKWAVQEVSLQEVSHASSRLRARKPPPPPRQHKLFLVAAAAASSKHILSPIFSPPRKKRR